MRHELLSAFSPRLLLYTKIKFLTENDRLSQDEISSSNEIELILQALPQHTVATDSRAAE